MSTSELEHADNESIGKNSVAEELGIDPRYEPVPEIDAHGEGLGALVDPWVRMQYPLNRENDAPQGLIQHSKKWQAHQRPDGSGVIKSSKGGAVYAVRTADGTVIGNDSRRMLWPYKSDFYDRDAEDPRELGDTGVDYIGVPFQFIGFVFTETTDVDMHEDDTMLARGTDEDNWVEGRVWAQGVVGADILDHDTEDGVLLTHENGQQVYIGWDSTSHDNFELFGFVPFDGENGIPAPSAEDALGLLRPNEAAASDQSTVERQGEWFLVPHDEEPEGTVQKPGLASKEWRYTAPDLFDIGLHESRHEAIGAITKSAGPDYIEAVTPEKLYPSGSPLDSHLPRDWKTNVDDETFVWRFKRDFGELFDVSDVETPQDCVDLLWQHEDEFDDDYDPYEDVRAEAEGIYVRGTLRHRDNEHEMVGVDEWRRATTHDWEVVTTDGQQFLCE